MIAETTPWAWAGGPDAGKTPRIYHGSSRGLVLSQILLRADPQHRTVGEWLLQEIAMPLSLDFYCGPGGEGAIDWASKPSATMTPPEPEFVFANDTLPKLIRKTFPDKYLLRGIFMSTWGFWPAVFRPLRTVFPGLGAGFLNLAGKMERTAKKRGKTSKNGREMA